MQILPSYNTVFPPFCFSPILAAKIFITNSASHSLLIKILKSCWEWRIARILIFLTVDKHLQFLELCCESTKPSLSKGEWELGKQRPSAAVSLVQPVSQIHQYWYICNSIRRRLVGLPRANLYGIAKEKEEGKGETAKIHLLLLWKGLQQLTHKRSALWKPVNAFLKYFATQRTDFQTSGIISSSSRARARILAWTYLSWANSLYTDNRLPLSHSIFLHSSRVSANTTISTTQQ